MPLTSILKNRRIFCVCFDISRTAAQIPTKLWEVNPKTLSFDLITKETSSVEWLLTSNRIKLFFNVFFLIYFVFVDGFFSEHLQSNQNFFSLIFVLIFIGVLAAISKQSWKTGYGIKFPKKWNTMWQDNPTICRLYRYRFFLEHIFLKHTPAWHPTICHASTNEI